MPDNSNGNGQSVFVLKMWQLLLVLFTPILLIGLSYGATVTKTEQNHNDNEYTRAHTVSNEQFNEMKEDFKGRLERIENKIDEQRSIQELTDMQRENARRKIIH